MIEFSLCTRLVVGLSQIFPSYAQAMKVFLKEQEIFRIQVIDCSVNLVNLVT